MKTNPRRSPSPGFTMAELLLILSCLFIFAVMLMPSMHGNKVRSSRINCVNNLRQVGLSFHYWALDNSNGIPSQVSVTNGGTLELVGHGSPFMHFAVMSNELSTPKVLFCPEEKDARRVVATTFNRITTPGTAQVPLSGNSNVSYFVGVDAREQFPQTFLSGDRGFGLAGAQFSSGLRSIWTNSALEWVNGPHTRSGNVGLADGSVQQLSSAHLKEANQWTGLATNRLEIP